MTHQSMTSLKLNPIEKFHQQRSDQDITGRIINGRKIVVKTRIASPHVISSGQNSPTSRDSPQRATAPPPTTTTGRERTPTGSERTPREEKEVEARNNSIEKPLSERFGDSNRREDRYDVITHDSPLL